MTKEVDIQQIKVPQEAGQSPPQTPSSDAPIWVTPKLEDVSEQVMAQPYIRFT